MSHRLLVVAAAITLVLLAVQPAAARTAHRIVSLSPTATESLFAIGAGPQGLTPTALAAMLAAIEQAVRDGAAQGRIERIDEGIGQALRQIHAVEPDLDDFRLVVRAGVADGCEVAAEGRAPQGDVGQLGVALDALGENRCGLGESHRRHGGPTSHGDPRRRRLWAPNWPGRAG